MGIDVGIDIGARKVKVTTTSNSISSTFLFDASDARLVADTLHACADTLTEDNRRLIDEKRDSEL